MKKVKGCYAAQVNLEFVLFLEKRKGMFYEIKKKIA